MSDLSIIILAAGKGTRMKSNLPKVMHKVAGQSMLDMVISQAKKLKPSNITIVSSSEIENFKNEILNNHKEEKINFALQEERKGTAHAVKIALEKIEKIGKKTLILYGDTPLISVETLTKMLEKLENSSFCVLGFNNHKENAYGRLVVNGNGDLEKIVEYKDASSQEKQITLCNSGVVAIDGDVIEKLISSVKNENAAKEFYLTDIVEIGKNLGLKGSFIQTNEEEVLGVNSKVELAQVENIKQNQLRKLAMEAGVTLIDPNSVYFSFDTKIANDVIIHPHVFFGKNVEISSSVEIKSFCHIDGAKILENAVIGPFARIRPETEILQNAKIGNFVEIKKSKIKEGAKISHLSYIGDSEIGQESNIGAGTITCNYDGYNKFKTKIGDNVFIGSNSALIAPVEIKDGAVIGAGSVISKNVEKDELAVARAKQISIFEGGKKFHSTKSKN